jgi:hypothetical protein
MSTTDAETLDPQQAIASVQQALFESLPGLPAERLVDILEFIATHHSGSSFNPDNQDKALAVAAFCQKSPFAVSKQGVGCLARLARHALGSSQGEGKSAEHQLWLLTSGALNTAAAIYEHGGEAVTMFEALRKDAAIRGKYMQRHYAQLAMRNHLEDPDAYRKGLEVDLDKVLRQRLGSLSPLQLFVCALLLFVSVILAVVSSSDVAFSKVFGQ